ncbi:hypothetical protein TEQG_03558 [Trichophyton equinum CBS 127.97]|uniref:Uncharacterized protein n=1 Tax=Trichophyton equinum (strain ATCC MYA-4606 / CBS 127.97) TaxID=559882 RepID=F2PS23_TRIEC|nr:hypothetical protein TEQG_03558 [Trichophyton equinum CBS 127.97]
MPRKKITAEERAKRLQERQFDSDKSSLSQERVKRELMPGTKRNYTNAMDLWAAYCQEHGVEDDDIFDQQTMKHFIQYMAAGARGHVNGMPMDSYIGFLWKSFTAKWRQKKGSGLPDSVTNSGKQWIYTKGELDAHVPLNREHRERNYLTLTHFQNLLQQLWRKDWYMFTFPIYQVYLSSLLKSCMYSSGRVGEYVESTARPDSDRGLYVEDGVTFVVIRSRKGTPELIVAPKRDAKGMTNRQQKCPRHPMQEDIESLPLYLNPVLEPLVICLARGLFRHFKTADEIFALEPTPEEPHYELSLRASAAPLFGDKPNAAPSEPDVSANDVERPKATGTPFYERVSCLGTTGKILKASWLSE